MNIQLPYYDNPPLDEVVCGVRFEPLANLRIPHIGFFWERMRKDFPLIEHQPPIMSEMGVPLDEVTGSPLPRLWFISADDDQLIQLQADLLCFNWRSRGKAYPRYDSILERFQSALSNFDTVRSEFGWGDFEAKEYELTYINQIPQEHGWSSAEDIKRILPAVCWSSDLMKSLPQPVNVAWQARFHLPNNYGWLNIKLSQGRRKEDNAPVLVLQLSAKGIAEDKSPKGVQDWFDQAHVAIVKGFEDITSMDVQTKVWGKRNA